MDLNQYKGNSNNSKNDISIQQEKEQVTNVVSGRKIAETPGRKFISEFLADDIHSIKDYIVYDVVIPAVKNAISDTITNGIDMLLFGQTRTRFNSNTIRKVGGINYTSFSSNNVSKANKITNSYSNFDERRTPGYRSAYTVDDILVPYTYEEPHNITKGKVTEALTMLTMRLKRYGMVSVADFYETVLNSVPDDIQDHKWGWYDLSGMRIRDTREGIVIMMPKNVEPIE